MPLRTSSTSKRPPRSDTDSWSCMFRVRLDVADQVEQVVQVHHPHDVRAALTCLAELCEQLLLNRQARKQYVHRVLHQLITPRTNLVEADLRPVPFCSRAKE